MTAVTISRELGSNGARVAEGVAAELGFDLVDKNTLNRVFRQYGLGHFTSLYDSKPRLRDFFDTDARLTLDLYAQLLRAFAQAGNVVLLGRGGFAVLGELDDVVDVRVTAPLPTRIERVTARRKGRTTAEAEARIAKEDRVRERFVKVFFGRSWNDPAGFDLVVDTETLSVDDAVAQVVEAVGQLPSDAGQSAAQEIDPVLARAVAQVLGRA